LIPLIPLIPPGVTGVVGTVSSVGEGNVLAGRGVLAGEVGIEVPEDGTEVEVVEAAGATVDEVEETSAVFIIIGSVLTDAHCEVEEYGKWDCLTVALESIEVLDSVSLWAHLLPVNKSLGSLTVEDKVLPIPKKSLNDWIAEDGTEEVETGADDLVGNKVGFRPTLDVEEEPAGVVGKTLKWSISSVLIGLIILPLPFFKSIS